VLKLFLVITLENFRYLISAHNDDLANSPSGRPRFFIRTYGCQMNSRDSEKLTGLLTQLGYAPVTSQDDADLILYNTCCVRESAEDKIWGHLSRLKKAKTTKPGLIIGVCGCMSQQTAIADKFKIQHKYVNLVFGTGNRHRLPEFLWHVISTGQQVIDITETDDLPELTDIPATNREFPHKAGVNIMYGCDNYCSYCIVPYVRGREKSRHMNDILQEITELANDGVKEVMLLGQNVNSFQPSFPDLLRQVCAIPGIQRVRFMTSHPKDFSDELIQTVAELPQVCNFMHLPIQSGSTKVLTDMNRKYTKDSYLGLISRLRAAIPGLAVSTDIIVGYPGETEEDFQDTLDVVRKVRFANAFTFQYSKRSGTPAAERTDAIPQNIKTDRFDRLVAELTPILLDINQSKIGKVFDVMVEEVLLDGDVKGRTEDHSLVHFMSTAPVSQGDIVQVRITTAKTFYLTGESV